MLGSAVLFALALLPLAALAAEELREQPYWRNCQVDKECVLIEGTCDVTAVNKAFAGDAAAFYKQQAKKADCVERFWQPKKPVAQCYLGGCSTAANAAKKKEAE